MNNPQTLVHRYFTEFLAGQVHVADEILAPDVVVYPPAYFVEPFTSRDAMKGFIAMVGAAFPDIRFTVTREVVQDPWVASAFTFEATHRGTYLGVPATGRASPVGICRSSVTR